MGKLYKRGLIVAYIGQTKREIIEMRKEGKKHAQCSKLYSTKKKNRKWTYVKNAPRISKFIGNACKNSKCYSSIYNLQVIETSIRFSLS